MGLRMRSAVGAQYELMASEQEAFSLDTPALSAWSIPAVLRQDESQLVADEPKMFLVWECRPEDRQQVSGHDTVELDGLADLRLRGSIR